MAAAPDAVPPASADAVFAAAVAVPFALLPFPGDPVPGGLQLRGHIRRTGASLQLQFDLIGPWQELRIPAPVPAPQRRDGLWQSTCLECFLALPGAASYWEVNVCPSGDWNGYRLADYRADLSPESGFTTPCLQRLESEAGLEARLELGLPQQAADVPLLEVGVSAVIATRSGAVSHWALAHPGPAADFHRRDAFLLRL